MVTWCISQANALNKRCVIRYEYSELSQSDPDARRSTSAKRLFQTQLFPDIHDSQRLPNLNSSTREQLYSIVLASAVDPQSFRVLLRLVQELNAERDESSQAWSWGIASKDDEMILTEPNWHLDRYKTLRAPVGYCGLRNLSNTCYMNSLFTQLYMNVPFRKFMMDINITDGAASQRLLAETRNLFGYMQGSALRAIDTNDMAEAIVTYDGTPVDVTHQVDVDEFFNLLFDRWENQIIAEDDRKEFRSFYGGQIVQQIKSKECEHISERLEPFSAIQCDIAGKSNLSESLNAYVQGEAMEGDNKYSCTSCGKYVDAVKRACFKELPHNLIFHLKRFDYDLMHGTRTKINDRFEFPFEIDMSTYNVDYRADQSKAPKPDVYSLVGVLVHSGTAESGHYYSYVQERDRSWRGKWVEFNDMDVSEFRSADIDSTSFGGWSEMTAYDSRFPKLWNAYMLFYERIVEPIDSIVQSPQALPPQVSLPMELQSSIAVDNQTFLRSFCQYDLAHLGFMKSLVRQLRSIHGQTCTSDHRSEKLVIELTLDFLSTVCARIKETALFDEMLLTLTRAVGSCVQCSILAILWLVSNKTLLSSLLLKCLHPKVRRETFGFIATLLHKLRQNTTQGHPPTEPTSYVIPTSNGPSVSVTAEMIVTELIEKLRGFWETLHTYVRAWDDYFGLIVEIAVSGSEELRLLLKAGFLQLCLELVVCDHSYFKALRSRQPYTNYTKMLEKGRKISHAKLLELIATFLERMDLQQHGESDDPNLDDSLIDFTDREWQLISHRGPTPKGYCIFLDRVLNLVGNPVALRRIVRSLTLAEPNAGLHPSVYLAIKNGVPVEPADLAQPFLEAALTYCECTPYITSAQSLIAAIARDVNTIGMSGGREHLQFFNQARRLRNLHEEENIDVFYKSVVSTAHAWAPPLLLYSSVEVRQNTHGLLEQIYFQRCLDIMDDEELADCLLEGGKRLCKACVSTCHQSLVKAKPLARLVDEVIEVIRTCLDQYFSSEEDHEYIVEATGW